MEQTEKLQEKVRIAREAVENLDSELKIEGFKIILKNLLEQDFITKKEEKRFITRPKPVSDEIDNIINSLNRSAYSEIHRLVKTLDRALFILKIVRDDVGIDDGLTPSDICAILSSKFRIKATTAAVGMALGGSRFVDRVRVAVKGAPPAYKYKLMHEGESYLQKVLQNDSNEKMMKNE